MNAFLRAVTSSVSRLFSNQNAEAVSANTSATPPLSLVQRVVGKTKRIGWWRCVPYEIAEPIPLRPSTTQPSRTYFWRGAKVDAPIFELIPSSIIKTVHTGFWRGQPVTFSIAHRATVA